MRSVIHFRTAAITINATSMRTSAFSKVAVEDFKSFEEIPGPKGLYAIPYLGTLLHYKPFSNFGFHDTNELLREFRDEYGDLMKFRIGKDYTVCLFTPELARQVLQKVSKYPFRKEVVIKKKYHERTGEPENLLNLNGPEWAKLRKLPQKLISRHKRLDPYLPKISRVVDDYIVKLKQSMVIEDTTRELYNYTAESIGILCFNKRLGFMDGGPRVDDLVKKLDIALCAVDQDLKGALKLYSYFRTPYYNRYETSVMEINNYVVSQIEPLVSEYNRLAEDGTLEDCMEKEPSLIFSLLSIKDLNIQMLKDTIASLFMAGIDSTAKTMSLVLQNLAVNPEKQDKLYEELIGKGLVPDQPLTGNVISSLPYLRACIKESMRLQPPTSVGLLRILEEDNIIGRYKIPQKTQVLVAIAVMSQDERIYKTPKAFLPERWMRTGDAKESKQTYSFAYLPFGHGPRNCLGKHVAERELQIGVAKLILNFRLSLLPGRSYLSHEYKLFACPKGKLSLKLEKR